VKDGKAGPSGPELTFERSEWAAFVAFAAAFEV
jgi:hypothetical protein